MKTILILSLALVGAFLLTFTLLPRPVAIAVNPDTTPPIILAVESGQADALFAQVDPGGAGSPNLVGIYNDLKQLAKDYRHANKGNLKEGIASRAQELMGQLFDAKVQREQQRITALELRLNSERERLKNMQMHKVDLVHTGTQKALQGGELPEWATPPK